MTPRVRIRQRIRRSQNRSDVVRVLRGGMEGVVLALVVVTPWVFGGVDPVYELVIAAGLSVLLILWAALTIASGRLSIVRCPVTLVMALIFVAGILQLMPLPPALLGVTSPGAAEIRQEMYSSTPEQLTPEITAAGPPAWPSTTVYPYVTRANAFRWLGLLILFAAVRNQIASTGSLWRLSLVMLINGLLLAVFALFQAFSKTARSPSGQPLIYWAYPGDNPFGPFMNRNHFAAYINLCIGLAVGLLFWLGPTEQDRKQRYMVKPNAPVEQREVLGMIFSPFGVLHSPAQLWALVGVGLMAAALMCSLSRGGFVSLVVALIATMCMRLSWPLRVRRLEVLLIPIVLIAGLFAFVGFRPLESRLGALVRGSASLEARWPMWADLATLAPRFWLLGSGYGTLGYVEPLTRSATTFSDPAMFVEHAHNDYLEALIEGGIVRAVLTLLLVGLVFAAGFRGLRRYLNRTPGALAVGAMTAFLAIALHSAVDFSMTTPAVAILAAVVAAQLVALNRADPTKPPEADHAHAISAELHIASAVTIGFAAVALSGLMLVHTWQADRVHRLKLEAYRVVKKTSPPNHEVALDYLQAAAATAPGDAELQGDIGQGFLDFGKEERRHALSRLLAQPTGAFWLALAADGPLAAAADVVAWSDRSLPAERQKELFRDRTVPALEHFAIARRLCPLLARPQMRFAAHAGELKKADPPAAYWNRALRLAPFDPDLWYFAGVQRLRDGQTAEAWQAWRMSLQVAPPILYPEQKARLKEHLSVMVKAAVVSAGSDPRRIGQALNQVLPDRPEEIVAAGEVIDPSLSATGPARPLIDRAIALLADRAEGLSPEQYHLKAQLQVKSGDPDGAIRAYGLALALAPGRLGWRLELDWRLEFARLLMDERRWKEASGQLTPLKGNQKLTADQAEQVKNWLDEVDREKKLEDRR